MAYRFNPPPNWPVEDANWTPPPGWQPDPSWGPAPEGWNFWVEGDAAPAAAPETSDEPTVLGSAQDVEPTPGSGTEQPLAAAGEPEQPVETAPAAEPLSGDETSSAAYGDVSTADDDATHVAGGAERDALSAEPAAAAAPAAAGSEQAGYDQVGSEQAADGDATHVAGSAEASALDADPSAARTAEYTGPDREAGLAQPAPYEDGATDQAAADQAAAGSGAGQPSEGQAPAAPAYGQQDQQGYGQASPAGYGQASPAGYGQDSAAPAYGQQEQQGYGQASPAAPAYGQQDQQGYGQASPAGYGQDSAAPAYGQQGQQGYGQASPAPYGQGSPAQGYGSPSAADGAAWTASTGAGEPPKKGIVARFWWVGCIALFLVVALIVAIIAVIAISGSGDEQAGGGSTTSAEATTSEAPSEDATTDESEEPADETVTPSVLPTLGAKPEAQDVVSSDGTGKITVTQEWIAADKLPSSYGGTVEPGENGDQYLVVTAQVEVTDGTLTLAPSNFSLTTPYGGDISPASATYGLKDAGLDSGAPDEFAKGDTYTIRLLFDAKKAGGIKLVYDTFSDQYTWDVPA